ncbi:MAG: class I SAM-dependent RNA methyltransferase [SAR324 cluster bacterium]|uniref:Class I SAM-dependent RNA methyltransferase n=1 Tax=SAR324 cluster bacterium TaxID=2024889 RepID=A0A7X9IJZ5_9DELT|nr:class I SAM-dependent RNA methyltransferase [SAR324 cluster bacterium]
MEINSSILKLRVQNISPGGAFSSEVCEGPGDLIGMKAFVRYVAPGELVHAKVIRKKKTYLDALLIDLVEASPERISPRCHLFGHCGGCDLQHLPISSQRHYKKKMIEDFLAIQGGSSEKVDVGLIDATLPDYSYRRRVTFHIDKKSTIGYYQQNSHDIIQTLQCPIATKPLNNAISLLHELPFTKPGSIHSISIEEAAEVVCLVFRMNEPVLPFPDHSIASLEEMNYGLQIEYNNQIVYRSAKLPPFVALAHFSQVNEMANEAMVSYVCSLVESREVCDLYAGSGNFALPLARKGCKVEAVELDQLLVGVGKRLAKQEGLDKLVRFHQQKCEDFAPNLPSGYTVILDPPREGAYHVIKYCRPERSPRIIYVSCSLPELIRDLEILRRSGYKLLTTTFIDMFPQTHHVETVNLLEAS